MTQITKEAIEAAHAEINKSWRNERWEWDAPKSAAERALRAALPFLPIAGEGKDGWKLVPRQPTAEMDGAGYDTVPSDMTIKTGVDHQDIWKAMFDAAPYSPGKDGGQEVEAVGQLREALQRLEDCCDQLAGTRSREVYDAMINSGQAEALIDLDNARLNAREVLSRPSPCPVSDTVAVVTGDAALALGLPEGTKLYTRPQRASTAQDMEVVAKLVYEAMRIAAHECDPDREKPQWVEGGNSLMQDQARRIARSISDAHPASTALVERLTKALDGLNVQYGAPDGISINEATRAAAKGIIRFALSANEDAELLHGMGSDAEFLRDLADRLRSIPVMHGTTGFDIDVLHDMARRLSPAALSSSTSREGER